MTGAGVLLRDCGARLLPALIELPLPFLDAAIYPAASMGLRHILAVCFSRQISTRRDEGSGHNCAFKGETVVTSDSALATQEDGRTKKEDG